MLPLFDFPELRLSARLIVWFYWSSLAIKFIGERSFLEDSYSKVEFKFGMIIDDPHFLLTCFLLTEILSLLSFSLNPSIPGGTLLCCSGKQSSGIWISPICISFSNSSLYFSNRFVFGFERLLRNLSFNLPNVLSQRVPWNSKMRFHSYRVARVSFEAFYFSLIVGDGSKWLLEILFSLLSFFNGGGDIDSLQVVVRSIVLFWFVPFYDFITMLLTPFLCSTAVDDR